MQQQLCFDIVDVLPKREEQTQTEWIIENLEIRGFITRNEALRQYCSRLGARMNELKRRGWEIKGEFFHTKFGLDYRYTLIGKGI